ncbi:MAG: SRPBCC domain-containing protein [Chloroflexi bacterium]|nr:SRPBCC domain-containing protein [Chloroflexota bacterium]MDA1281970.1 SRPBCC domain-containing protein [Chloroflexota bacterium]
MTTIEHPERTLVIERTFDAPRSLVYEVWTSDEHIDKWWGPSMMTTKTVERNFSVGGAWKYEMFMPDGKSMGKIVENNCTEIVPNEKIVWDEPIAGDDSNQVNVTLLFEETKLTMLILHTTAEQKEMNEKGGMLMGFNMTLDSFAEFVAEQTS